MASTLTVIVPTFNEEDNIRECLESVKWADDLFVVDSFSTDGTVGIAREFTEHVVQHEYVNSATQKNWAIPQVKSDWVMVVDADERVPAALQARVQDILENGSDFDGFQIKRTTTYFGKIIRHCGWHKDYLVRLWRNGKGRYEDLEVHADVLIDGRLGRIEEPLMHHTYRTMADYMERFDRYTTWSANDLYNRGKRASWVSLTFRPLWRFFRMYVLRGGFLDGKHGFVLCAFAASSVFAKYAKLWERRLREAAGGEHARPADPT